MKTRSATQVVAGILFVLALGGCASTQNQASTGEYVDDTVITIKVKTAILDDKFDNGLAVNVETFKGVVQLSGFVKNTAERDKAVTLAGDVKGVKQVKNSIMIR